MVPLKWDLLRKGCGSNEIVPLQRGVVPLKWDLLRKGCGSNEIVPLQRGVVPLKWDLLRKGVFILAKYNQTLCICV